MEIIELSKTKLGSFIHLILGNFYQKGVILKSQNNQLKSADIGHEFCILTKTKSVGHDSHSILVPEFEFDHDILKILKIQNFQNLVEQSKQIPPDSENSVFLKISKHYGQIQTQGPKLSGKHTPHV